MTRGRPLPLVDPRLTWRPKRLTNAVTVAVQQGRHQYDLDPARDHRIVLPAVPLTGPGGLILKGGRNLRGQAGIIDTVKEANPRGRSHEARTRYIRVQFDCGIRLVSIDEAGGMVHRLGDVQREVWLLPSDVEAA